MKTSLFILMCSLMLCACNEYGKQVNKGNVDVYYKDGISEAQAQRTAEVLHGINKTSNGETGTKSFQIQQRGDTVILRMVADAAEASELGNEAFESMGLIISDSVFNKKPVAIEITDNRFNNGKYIAFNPNVVSDFGQRYQEGNVEVYYRSGVTEAEVQQVQAYLLNAMQPDNLISFQLLKDHDNKFVLKMASTREQATSFDKSVLHDMAGEISANLLSGDQLTFSITDESFNPVQTAVYTGK